MKTSTKIIAFILSISLLFLLVSCNSNTENPSSQNSSSTTENKSPLDLVMNKEEQDSIRMFINNIEPDFDPWQSYVSYSLYKEESDTLVTVGINGFPVILTELKKIDTDNSQFYRSGFLIEGLHAILRVDGGYVENFVDSYIQEDHDVGYKAERIINFYRFANEEAPKIISSNQDIDAKLEQLRYLGLFAIPYVTAEIKKGNTEYEAFFTEIGLHLTVQEFMEIMSDINLPYPEHYDKAEFAKGAEDFDYKQWLSENQENLDAMFKFLDEYTKE